jgi:hypothetical protein
MKRMLFFCLALGTTVTGHAYSPEGTVVQGNDSTSSTALDPNYSNSATNSKSNGAGQAADSKEGSYENYNYDPDDHGTTAYDNSNTNKNNSSDKNATSTDSSKDFMSSVDDTNQAVYDAALVDVASRADGGANQAAWQSAAHINHIANDITESVQKSLEELRWSP